MASFAVYITLGIQVAVRFIHLFLVALLGLSQAAFAGVAGSTDRAVAQEVAKILVAKYGKFDDRKEVEKSKKGKIYYLRPGVGGNPTFNFYEITTEEEISVVKSIAESALKEVSGANSITLKFYEAQNWRRSQSGSVRLAERLIKSVKLVRSSS